MKNFEKTRYLSIFPNELAFRTPIFKAFGLKIGERHPKKLGIIIPDQLYFFG